MEGFLAFYSVLMPVWTIDLICKIAKGKFHNHGLGTDLANEAIFYGLGIGVWLSGLAVFCFGWQGAPARVCAAAAGLFAGLLFGGALKGFIERRESALS